MAEPQAAVRAVPAGDGHRGCEGVRVLQVEREGYVGAHLLEQLVEGGHVVGERGAIEAADRAPGRPPSDDPVVIEDDHPVLGEPGVTFEARGPQTARQVERGQRVLGRVSFRGPVREADGRL